MNKINLSILIFCFLVITCGCIRMEISWNENIDGSKGAIKDGNRVGIYVTEIRYNENAKVTYIIENIRYNTIYIPKVPHFAIGGIKEGYGNTQRQEFNESNFYKIEQFEKREIVIDIRSIFAKAKQPFILEDFEIQGYYKEYKNDDDKDSLELIKPFYINYTTNKKDPIIIKENAQQGVAPEPVKHQ